MKYKEENIECLVPHETFIAWLKLAKVKQKDPFSFLGIETVMQPNFAGGVIKRVYVWMFRLAVLESRLPVK